MEKSIGSLNMKDGWIVDNTVGSFQLKPGTNHRLWILCEQIPHHYLNDVDPQAHFIIFNNNEHWLWFHFLGWREVQSYTINETIQYIKLYQEQNNIDEVYALGACNGSYNALHFGFLLNAKWIGAMAPLTSLLGEDHPVGKSYSSFHSNHAKHMLEQAMKRNNIEIDYFRIWTHWNTTSKVSFYYYRDNPHHIRALSLIPSEHVFSSCIYSLPGNKHIEIIEELHSDICNEIREIIQNSNVDISPKASQLYKSIGNAQYRFIQDWNQPRLPGFFRPNDTFFILRDENGNALMERRARQWGKFLKQWHIGPIYFLLVRYHEHNDDEHQIEFVNNTREPDIIPYFLKPNAIRDELHNIFILPGHWHNLKKVPYKKSKVYQDDWQVNDIQPRSIFSQRIVGFDTFYFPFIWEEYDWDKVAFPQNPSLLAISNRVWQKWKHEETFLRLLHQWDEAGLKVAICQTEHVNNEELNTLLKRAQFWLDYDILLPLHHDMICKVLANSCIPFILLSKNSIPISIFPQEWYIYVENISDLERKSYDIWLKPISYWEYPWSRLMQEFQNSKIDANLNIARWLGYWTPEQVQIKLSEISYE